MERWLSVPGYEGLYEVSDHGRVRSLPRNATRGKVLKPTVARRHRSGGQPAHCAVGLVKNGQESYKTVHGLVLLAFVGPCPDGMEGRHYPDPDPTNNRLENLSWSTPLVNQHDRYEHGTHNFGVRHPAAKLDEAAVRRIREIKTWTPGLHVAMARELGIASSTLSDIKSRRTWGHLE